MAEKKAKKSAVKPKKSDKGKLSLLLRSLKLAIVIIFILSLSFATYVIFAYLEIENYEPMQGMNIHSDKIFINDKQCQLIVGNQYSRAICHKAIKIIREAENILIVDLYRLPDSDNFSLADELISKKLKSPGLFVLLILDEGAKYSNDYSDIAKNGINVIFSDYKRMNNYRWIYNPAGDFLGDITGDYGFKLNQNKRSRRNLIISSSSNGYRMLAGSFAPSFDENQLELALYITGSPAIPFIKSELELSREYLGNEENIQSSVSLPSILRQIEFSLAELPNPEQNVNKQISIELLSEKNIIEKLKWMLKDVSNGDDVNIICGKLDDPAVIESIAAADNGNSQVKVIMDRNIPAEDFESSPGIPNYISAAELIGDKKEGKSALKVKWLERVNTSICCIHVFNTTTSKSRLLLLSSDLTTKVLGGYDLSSAIYIEGWCSTAIDFKEIFSDYWQNRRKSLFSSESDKYERGFLEELYNKFFFSIKYSTDACY